MPGLQQPKQRLAAQRLILSADARVDRFVDLTEAAKDLAPTHFPSIIESQTVNGKLVSLRPQEGRMYKFDVGGKPLA